MSLSNLQANKMPPKNAIFDYTTQKRRRLAFLKVLCLSHQCSLLNGWHHFILLAGPFLQLKSWWDTLVTYIPPVNRWLNPPSYTRGTIQTVSWLLAYLVFIPLLSLVIMAFFIEIPISESLEAIALNFTSFK